MDFKIIIVLSILVVLTIGISIQVGGAASLKGKKIIILYYAPWCGNCTEMMPEWNKFEAKHKKDPTLIVKKVNSDKNPQAVEQAKIEHFPTIILYKDGKKHTFDKERRAEALEEFVSAKNEFN